MSFFPNTTIKIERNIQTGISLVGSPNFEPQEIITDLNATIVKDANHGNDISYETSGQINVAKFILTCTNYLNIRIHDIITDLSSGQKYRVISEPYSGSLISHVQAKLKLDED